MERGKFDEESGSVIFNSICAKTYLRVSCCLPLADQPANPAAKRRADAA
ncbi:hypothetical protein Fuma_02096 [Fuerstiella marisgermanici]|uniref:Uncharacterized protein n=1 Tax=Fuerstiella marisgermanici TaxID=1891926 RepID=A0A1P8WEJ0_9PLAN|nr:hypothetical protein Fuma_02096 [Fuerstiella marisgermanici]